MDRIGRQLLKDSKSALERAEASGTGEKDEIFRRRDLLSLLLKANMSTEVPEGQRMSDEDVVARESLFLFARFVTCVKCVWRVVVIEVPTFLVAGHETTRYAKYLYFIHPHAHLIIYLSNATTWALYALCLSPTIQTKLREELYTIQTDNPSMDELNSLPYLDAVVRETLRIHAPVASTIREAMKDDILPLATPFVDKKGRIRDSIL
jgi:cytochrome P450